MKLPPLLRGRLIERENRFRAKVLVDGRPAAVHVADPGRAAELLVPGRTVWVTTADKPGRRTAFTLILVEHEGILVSLRSHLANDLLSEALADGRALDGPYDAIEREVRRGASRFDFRLTGDGGVVLVEAKSVTLVEGGVALFPDAPTARGRHHMDELADIAAHGEGAAVAFVVQRPDASVVSPHAANDPNLAAALWRAAKCGVAIHAYGCRVSLEEIRIDVELPVRLTAPEG